MKTIIGIDPGTKGAIAILQGIALNTKIVFHPMPLVNNELDIFEFNRLIHNQGLNGSQGPIILLEDVHAIFGASAKSTFNFGYICGQINTVCCQYADTILVQPKVWQKEIWIESDIVKGETKRKSKKTGLPIYKIDTKLTSLNACKRIFPLVNIPTTPRSKVPHDGIVDALLISEYGRRTYE